MYLLKDILSKMATAAVYITRHQKNIFGTTFIHLAWSEYS